MSPLAFILGREPHISVAEIATVIGDRAEWAKVELSSEALVLPTPSRSPSPKEGEKKRISLTPAGRGGEGGCARSLMARLGGTIKIGEVWRTVAYSSTPDVFRLAASSTSGVFPYAIEAIGRYILDATTADRKVTFGYSMYDLGAGAARVREVRESLRRGAAAQKAWLKEHRRTVRWVTSREPTLSSVVVAKNDLLPERNGVEVLVLVGAEHIILARTLAVQPFEEWSRRDYGRPSRDARSGMLPPKLARIMVNLALRQAQGITTVPERAKRVEGRSFTLLDPFCGSGTILTEAMALGVPKIIGTDVSAEAVEDTKANIAWTHGRKSFSPSREGERLPAEASAKAGEEEGSVSVHVRQCDVRRLSRCVRERVDAIVTEPYLGPPIRQQGSRAAGQHGELIAELRALYLAAFREFAKVLKPGGRAVFIVPIFRERKVVLDITQAVAQFGFHRIEPFPAPLRDHPILRSKVDLPYARSDQRVGRMILVFELSKRHHRVHRTRSRCRERVRIVCVQLYQAAAEAVGDCGCLRSFLASRGGA